MTKLLRYCFLSVISFWVLVGFPGCSKDKYIIPDGAVDMGLSVCWASCNLGASDERDPGSLFAWGETKTKDIYLFDTYRWFDGWQFTKYVIDKYKGTGDSQSSPFKNEDMKTILEMSDDAAAVDLGNGWRMPTKEEIEELVDNCIWTYVSDDKGKGFYAKSKLNGNELFFPATGVAVADRIESDDIFVFWSSSLCTTSADRAWGLSYVYSPGIMTPPVRPFLRAYGYSIRPVIEPIQIK